MPHRGLPAQRFFVAQHGLVQPGGQAGCVVQQALAGPAPLVQHAAFVAGAVAQLLREKAAAAMEASVSRRFIWGECVVCWSWSGEHSYESGRRGIFQTN